MRETNQARPARRLFRWAMPLAASAVIASSILFAPFAANADPAPATPNLTVGTGLQLENGGQPGVLQPQLSSSIKLVQATGNNGTFQLLDQVVGNQGSGKCFMNMTPIPFYVVTIQKFPCQTGNPMQSFYFVPVNTHPNADAGSSANDHWFYIVSALDNKCVEMDGDNKFRVYTCDSNNVRQRFRVMNDTPTPVGISAEWREILTDAVAAGSSRCILDTGDCQVSPSTGPTAGQWYSSNDPDVGSLGTISSRSLGCGTPAEGQSSQTQNLSSNPIPLLVSTTQTMTNTISVADTVSVMVGAEYSEGIKDVWGAKIQASFSYNHQQVTTVTASDAKTESRTLTANPGEWVMGMWNQQIYTISGTWRLGIDIPTTTPGALAWQIPSTSTYPAGVVGGAPMYTYTASSSHDAKNCTAAAASQIGLGVADKPAPVLHGVSCADAVTTDQVASAFTTVTACPGNWNIPADQSNYSYQWYLSQGGTSAKVKIPNANGPAYVIQPSDISNNPSVPNFLSVSAQDRATPARLDSDVVLSTASIKLAPSVSLPATYPTVFSPLDQEATVGSPFSDSVVASAGSASHLTADSSQLPPGLTLSTDGVLSGTPTAAGSYSFTVTDTPTDGPVQTYQAQLVVSAPATRFVDAAPLTGVVGTAVNVPLVITPGTGAVTVTDGTLPNGVSVDAAGTLSGVPTESGTFAFTLGETGGSDAQGSYTLTITDTATAFASALPTARVGAAYSAPIVAALGSNAVIGIANSLDTTTGEITGFAGLSLNADTGVISGTPTTAGVTTLTFGDLTDPSAAPVSMQFTVLPADSATGGTTASTGGSGSATTLAATGANVIAPIGLGVLLAIVGLVFMLLRRRPKTDA